MWNIARAITAVTIATAISLPMIPGAQACTSKEHPANRGTPHNLVGAPATTQSPTVGAPRPFKPAPLDPDYHNSGVG